MSCDEKRAETRNVDWTLPHVALFYGDAMRGAKRYHAPSFRGPVPVESFELPVPTRWLWHPIYRVYCRSFDEAEVVHLVNRGRWDKGDGVLWDPETDPCELSIVILADRSPDYSTIVERHKRSNWIVHDAAAVDHESRREESTRYRDANWRFPDLKGDVYAMRLAINQVTKDIAYFQWTEQDDDDKPSDADNDGGNNSDGSEGMRA